MTVELGALIAAVIVVIHNLRVGAAFFRTSPTRAVRLRPTATKTFTVIRNRRYWIPSVLIVLALVALSTPRLAAQSTQSLIALISSVLAQTEEINVAVHPSVTMYRINSVTTDSDRLACTSDRDLTAHVSLHVSGTGGGLSVGTLFQNGALHENNMTINETVGMTFGATTGDELRVRVSSAGQPNFVFATVTVESVGGADVRCTLS